MEYKLCKRGHVRSPDNLDKRGNCITCARLRAREWAISNPDKVKENQKKHNSTEKHKNYASEYFKKKYIPSTSHGNIKEYCKRGHARTPDNLNKTRGCKECAKINRSSRPDDIKQINYEQSKQWAKNNPQKIREYSRRTREKHKDYYKQKLSIWRLNNPDKYKLQAKKYYLKNKNKYASKAKSEVANLTNSRVANTLRIPVSIATFELLEIKRLTIQLKRSLKNDNQI